ncbi:MAG: CvpA family protein, partial [Eubacteriales bacterium]
MATFDIIIIILLIAGAITGYRKGVLTGIARLVGKIVAFAAAWIFHVQFLEYLESVIALRSKIEPQLYSLLTKVIEKQVVSIGNADSIDATQQVIGKATGLLANYALKVIAFISLFIIVSLLVNIFIRLVISPLAKSLGIVNSGGGLVFGLFSTFLVLSL